MPRTELQAKVLWCPMGKIGHAASGATVNDPTFSDFHVKCIASQCAMWRWAKRPELTVCLTLDRGQVERLIGLRFAPSFNPAMMCGPRPSKEELEDLEAWMTKAMVHQAVIGFFSPAGWDITPDGVQYDGEDDFVLFANYARSADASATGFCGLAGRPGGA